MSEIKGYHEAKEQFTEELELILCKLVENKSDTLHEINELGRVKGNLPINFKDSKLELLLHMNLVIHQELKELMKLSRGITQ